MGADSDCVFCKIVQGEIPCHKVFEDGACLAFMDIAPLAEGHILVVPKAHHETLAEMPADAVAQVASHLPMLTAAVMRVANVPGCNVLQNNGTVAGQVVAHVHFHVIPRTADDDLGYRWPAGEYAPGRDEAVHAALQKAVAALA